MPLPEIVTVLHPGEPGGEVDEDLQEEKSQILFTICDDQGKLASLSFFSRNVSPEFISEDLNNCANDLEENPPSNVSPQLINKLISLFRKYAREVPGLNE